MTKIDKGIRIAAWMALWTTSMVCAQPALKVEPVPSSRSVKATIVNPSASACGAELAFGDGREEKFRLEGRETRQVDHAYASEGSYTVRLKGEAFVRGLRTALPCEFDESQPVRLATAAAGAAASTSSAARPAAPPAGAAPQTTAATAVPPVTPAPVTPVPRVAGPGDDLLLWRRSASPALEFVTGADGKGRLVSGEVLRWSGFDVCWLALPGHSRALGGDGVQSIALGLMEAQLSSQVGGRPVRGRFVDCAPGGALQGDADVLMIQRDALPLIRARLVGFSRFEPTGELSHSLLLREHEEVRGLQTQRAAALSTLVAEQQASDDRQRRQGLARQFPYTATLRCAGPSGPLPTSSCLTGRTLRAQLELSNGESTRQYAAPDLAQAGTETPQGLVILLRDRFTIETQNVEERATLTLRIVETASDQLIFERSAGRFEMLRASR
jgi:hypothetical protein